MLAEKLGTVEPFSPEAIESATRELIEAACVKFDLSPLDADHLLRQLRTKDR